MFSAERPVPIVVLKSAMKQPSRPASPQISPTASPFAPRVSLPSTPQVTSSPTIIGSDSIAHSPDDSSLPIPSISIPSSSTSTSAESPTGISSPLTALGLGLHTPYASHLAPNSPQVYSVMSPPLTPGYTPKVSFDTFENQSASMFSFTLQVKTDAYRRTRSTRVFLCAASPDETGREALDWCLEALVQDGDELIVFRGVDEDVLGTHPVKSRPCARMLTNPHTEKDHDLVREEARELMRSIQSKSVEYDPDRKVSLSSLPLLPAHLTPAPSCLS